MFIRSTGLGRTLLTCHVAKIEVTHMVPSTLEPPEEDEPAEPARLLMTIQTTDPVNWTVRGFVEPADLLLILKAAMTPAVIWTAIKFLFAGGAKKKNLAESAQGAVPEQAKA
ncbi:MAG: hypothetical protein HZB55_12590 [Deltaproteobacteria bacterium]|nr:hypothetical protein [Deltaproteobacteria bacterium]